MMCYNLIKLIPKMLLSKRCFHSFIIVLTGRRYVLIKDKNILSNGNMLRFYLDDYVLISNAPHDDITEIGNIIGFN